MKTLRTSGEIAELFAIDPQTLRNWCTDFKEFLSPQATPTDGSHRRFTEPDVSVFALVHQMRKEGMKIDEVYVALRNNQRGTEPSRSELAVRDNPEMALALMRGRLIEMETDMLRIMDENARLRGADARALLLAEQLALAQTKIDQLNREIGRLEGGKS